MNMNLAGALKRRINLRRAGERAAARRAELAARRAEALGTDGARRFAADLRAEVERRGLVVMVEEQ